ncbi:MAG: hypothetical protein PHV23_05265 [Candidatus Gracilibacteria bacterium]|nr:hypothetical protein [Candidatus Gracilibacteria bacterium]
MSEFELAMRAIVIFVVVITILNLNFWEKIDNTGYDSNKSLNNNYGGENYYKDNSKLYKQIDKYYLKLEEVKIKKEEIENEIERLTFDGNISFEKERENNTKIKKLSLEVKYLNIQISEIKNNIDKINREIQGIY